MEGEEGDMIKIYVRENLTVGGEQVEGTRLRISEGGRIKRKD